MLATAGAPRKQFIRRDVPSMQLFRLVNTSQRAHAIRHSCAPELPVRHDVTLSAFWLDTHVSLSH